MSHVYEGDTEITNLEALKSAVADMGFTFVENATEFLYWNNQRQACAHKIKVPGATYEVGVVQKQDGTYRLAADYYSEGGLVPKIGNNAVKLIQGYNVAVTKKSLKRGQYIKKVLKQDNGNVRIIIGQKG